MRGEGSVSKQQGPGVKKEAREETPAAKASKKQLFRFFFFVGGEIRNRTEHGVKPKP